MNLYAILGIPRDATKADVRKAYRRMSKKAHPDAGGSSEKFALVRTAHDVLTDEARRAKYDETGAIEDKPIDNALGDALQWVKAAIDHVLNVCDQRKFDPSSVDIVSDAKTFLRGKIGEGKEANKQTAKQAAKLRRVADRFKPKRGKENLIRGLFAAQIGEMERGISNNERMIANATRGIEILEDHTFDWTESRIEQDHYLAKWG